MYGRVRRGFLAVVFALFLLLDRTEPAPLSSGKSDGLLLFNTQNHSGLEFSVNFRVPPSPCAPPPGGRSYATGPESVHIRNCKQRLGNTSELQCFSWRSCGLGVARSQGDHSVLQVVEDTRKGRVGEEERGDKDDLRERRRLCTSHVDCVCSLVLCLYVFTAVMM